MRGHVSSLATNQPASFSFGGSFPCISKFESLFLFVNTVIHSLFAQRCISLLAKRPLMQMLFWAQAAFWNHKKAPTPQRRMRTLFRFRENYSTVQKAKAGSMVNHPKPVPCAAKQSAAQHPPVLNAIVILVAVRLCQLTTNLPELCPFCPQLVLCLICPFETRERAFARQIGNIQSLPPSARSDVISHHEYRAPPVWQVEEERGRPGQCCYAPQRI
jgi:hypothetical protein